MADDLQPSRASQQARTARWRRGLRERRVPETDAVDSALAAALAIYADASAARRSVRDLRRIATLENMAVCCLVSRGYAAEQARRRVVKRVHRPDVYALVSLVNDEVASTVEIG